MNAHLCKIESQVAISTKEKGGKARSGAKINTKIAINTRIPLESVVRLKKSCEKNTLSLLQARGANT